MFLNCIFERLFEKQVDYENLEAEYVLAGTEIRSLQLEDGKKEETISILEEKIHSLEETVTTNKINSDETIQSLRMKIAEMKHDIDCKEKTIEELRYFENGHKDLDSGRLFHQESLFMMII